MDHGFEAAGFSTRVAVERDPDCCETLRRNRPWPVIQQDIFDTPTPQILSAAGLRRGQVDLLFGGPPCQPFSKAGYWSKGDSLRLDDPRAGTLDAYMRVVEETLPTAFVLENVTGLAFSGKDEGLMRLLERVKAINKRTNSSYRPDYKIMKAVEFGVPQVRERFILVAHRDGTRFNFPVPTHRPPDTGSDVISPGLSPFSTAWDAIGDLPMVPDDAQDLQVRGKWAALLPTIPEGMNYLYHTERGEGLPLFGWRRRYWTFLLKLSKHRPSWTLQAQPGPAVGPFHWNNRRLSSKELCRLQTFPDDVELSGGHSSVQRQAGNAVPSLLAEVVGRSLRQQWFDRRTPSELPLLLPATRRSVPPPERTKPVPKQYLDLRDSETAHPGTGKGYGALARPSRSSPLEMTSSRTSSIAAK